MDIAEADLPRARGWDRAGRGRKAHYHAVRPGRAAQDQALRLSLVGAQFLLSPYRLKIDTAGRAPRLPARRSGRRVEVWRDARNRICAYGEAKGRECWMHFPGLAAYRFSRFDEEITAFPASPGREAVIRDLYHRSVLPMALHVQGREVLHASAVLAGAHSVAFCGRSGAGKSTIAYGLSERGYRQWADDSVALDRVDGRIHARRLPFGVRLRPEPARYFGMPAKDALPLGTVHTPPILRARSAELSALFVLDQVAPHENGADPVDILKLCSSELFTAVLPHAYCFSLADSRRKRRMVRHFLDIGSKVRTFRVRFSADLQRLPLLLDRIEEILERS
jgi:hypothetical protein